MSKILVGLESAIGLGLVIAATAGAGGLARQGRVGGDDGGALRQKQMDAAFEMDGKAEEVAGGKQHRPAAGGRAGLYGAVDGGGVQRLAIAPGAIITNIKERGTWRRRLCGL